MACVYCAVRTGSSNRKDYVSFLKDLMKCLRMYAKYYRTTNGDLRFYWWFCRKMICCGDNYKKQSKIHEWLRRLKVRWAMKEMKLSESAAKDSSHPGRCDLLAGRVTDVSKYRTAFILWWSSPRRVLSSWTAEDEGTKRAEEEEELYVMWK
jgi:hypothetical protein